MTYTSTLTGKNQTTIPKPIVEALALRPSAKLLFELEPSGKITLTAKTKTFAELAGTFAKSKRRKTATIEEMNDAIREGAAESFRRSVRR